MFEHDDTRLTIIFRDNPDKPSECLHSGFYCS